MDMRLLCVNRKMLQVSRRSSTSGRTNEQKSPASGETSYP